MSIAVSHRPDPDELAAFLDGQLSGEERQKLEAHLGTCEACREIVAESLQLLEDVSEEDLGVADDRIEADEADLEPEGGKVLTHPGWRRTAWRLAPLAAAAALGLLLWPTLRSFWQPRPLSSAELVAAFSDQQGLGRRLVEGWLEPLWSVFRGSSSYIDNLTEDQVAFQLGVRSVDLQVALRSGSNKEAQEISQELIQLLERGVDWGRMVASVYQQILVSMEQSPPDEQTSRSAAEAEEQVEDLLDSDYFSVGRWAEAGRLAAMVGDEAYFKNRAVLREARKLEQSELLKPKTIRQIHQIRGISSEPLDQNALLTLRAVFDEIIRTTG